MLYNITLILLIFLMPDYFVDIICIHILLVSVFIYFIYLVREILY